MTGTPLTGGEHCPIEERQLERGGAWVPSWEPERRGGAGWRGGLCVRVGAGLWGAEPRQSARGGGYRVGGGPQGDGDPLGLSGISGRQVLPRLRVTPNRWGVVSALGGVENRLGPGVSAAAEPGNTAGEAFSSAPGRATAAQSLRPSSLPSPSGCSVPRSGLPAPPSCSTSAERLFWQNMPSRGHNCSRKTFPLLFPGTALGSFPSGVVTKARGCGHSGSDDGTPFASALRAPSGPSFTFPTAELQQLVLGTLSRLQDQPHGATREPKGVLLPWCLLLVTPYNLCTFVSHHWTDTLVVVGQTLVCPTSLEECLSSLVCLQYHRGGSSN